MLRKAGIKNCLKVNYGHETCHVTKRKNKGNWWRINFVWINKLEFLIEEKLFTFGITSKLSLGI